MTTAPFWSDDFDMDLLKVIPGIEADLGDVASLTLYTHGNETFGRLNHPSVWNSSRGADAFFGFYTAAKDAVYSTGEPLVECTWLEAVRDCWSHDYAIFVERRLMLDGNRFRWDFDAIMNHVRKWRPVEQSQVDHHIRRARARILTATCRLRELHESQRRPLVGALASEQGDERP